MENCEHRWWTDEARKSIPKIENAEFFRIDLPSMIAGFDMCLACGTWKQLYLIEKDFVPSPSEINKLSGVSLKNS